MLSVFHADGDGDGCGDPAISVEACEAPAGFVAADGDGFAACEECDDASAEIHPDATEVCDGVDNDCDGLSDDADDSIDAATQTGWYADGDGDGYGDAAGAANLQCEAPSGTVADHTDCDDTSADVNPAATEVCDDADVDEDCSGAADDADAGVDATTYATFYLDADTDGYGDAAAPVSQCDAPSGYVADDDWTGFSANSNGQVTFDFSHTDFSPSVSEFLSDGVAIAINGDDLRAAGGSTTVVVEHDDAVAVHFRDVPDFYSVGNNNWTVAMHDSGLMHFSSIDVNDTTEMVGWSCGDDSTVTESALSVEIAERPTGAVGLEASGARAHYEFLSYSWDLLGQSWMMCGTAGDDTAGDGWSDICGDLDDGDASVYPGSSGMTGGGCGSGDTGCEDTGVVPS